MRPRVRIKVLGVFFLLAFGGILLRAVHLQLLPHQKVERFAEHQQHSKVEVVGRRGTLYDRNGRELAVSVNSLSLYANPHLVKDRHRVAKLLAPVLGSTEAAVLKKVTTHKKRKFVWIQRQLSAEQMQALAQIPFASLEGVGTLNEFRRTYPQGSLASHVLGFTSIDGQGLEGVEKKFENLLAKDKSVAFISKDALGRPLLNKKEQIQLTLNSGDSLELTLDSSIQYAAEVALREAVQHHQALSGTAIVLDPRNGEVLALANEPSFDPNEVANYPGLYRKNRALTDPIEPGSVMKPFVVAKAIQDHIVSEQFHFNTSAGKILVGKKWIRESDSHHRRDRIDMADLIRISSNVATVMLQQKMGYEKIYQVFQQLGFSSVTGIDLGAESRGIFRKASPTQVLEQATQSFGQGIALTPMQIVRAWAAIAGDGKLVVPTLVKKKFFRGGAEVGVTLAQAPTVFDARTVTKMRKILERVVEDEGTGTLARVAGIRVAGKTGTAQKVDFVNGGYKRGAYWSSFVGFLPSEHPQFLIYVMIDEPTQNGYYGGLVAAPVFQKIARAALRLSDFTPRMAIVTKASPPKSVAAPILKKEKTEFCVIENLVGLSLTQALKNLENLGCGKVDILSAGTFVVDQQPSVGTKIRSEQPIYLKLR